MKVRNRRSRRNNSTEKKPEPIPEVKSRPKRSRREVTKKPEPVRRIGRREFVEESSDSDLSLIHI